MYLRPRIGGLPWFSPTEGWISGCHVHHVEIWRLHPIFVLPRDRSTNVILITCYRWGRIFLSDDFDENMSGVSRAWWSLSIAKFFFPCWILLITECCYHLSWMIFPCKCDWLSDSMRFIFSRLCMIHRMWFHCICCYLVAFYCYLQCGSNTIRVRPRTPSLSLLPLRRSSVSSHGLPCNNCWLLQLIDWCALWCLLLCEHLPATTGVCWSM